MMFNRLVHHDLETGSRKVWGEDRYLLGEPILAHRSEDAAEGDGYILVLAHDIENSLTELLVLPAEDIEAGPLATVKLPVRIPMGFHGTWVGA